MTNCGSSAQVRRAVDELKLKGAAARMAFAVACSSAEFLKAQPSCTLNDYVHLRAEFMKLLGIDRDDFNMLDICRLNCEHPHLWFPARISPYT